MKLLLQFPTLGRPEKFINCLEQYISKSSGQNSLYFNINCDDNDQSMNNDEIKRKIYYLTEDKNHIEYSLHFDQNTSKISAINNHINEDFDIVICLSDDMIPQMQDWDLIISDNMKKYFPDTNGCLHFNDGNQGDKLITLSILGKKLYDYFGYIYHPDYKSLYCDNEFTEIVKRLNKVKYIDQIIISHEHYSVKGSQNYGDNDEATNKTLLFSGRDSIVYEYRKQFGFPRERITDD